MAKSTINKKPESPPSLELKIETWPIDDVLPYAKNARLHSDQQIAAIAVSIKEFGFVNPCLVDAAGMLIAGHGRVLASKLLGATTIPVIKLGHLSKDQVRALRVADNALPLQATWDAELIKAELNDLKLHFDIQIIGFPEIQLRAFGVTSGTDSEQDPEAIPERPKKPVVRRGDLWVLGDHRLLCGDSTNPDDVGTSLGGAKPNLMVTDPPYGVEYDPAWRADANKWKGSLVKLGAKAMGKVSNDHLADWGKAWVLFGGDVAYVWHGGLRSVEQAIGLERCGFVMRSQIIWNKGRLVISRGDYHWQHEACWYAVRKGRTGHWCGIRTQSTVWDIAKPQVSETGHGTQKPVECMKRPIENNSRPGDFVYEPFSGSGTTIIACEMTGRRCLAIELDPGYCQVAIERWAKFSGRKALLDGKTLEQVAKARRTGRAKSDETGDPGKPVPGSNTGEDGGKRRLREGVHARRAPSKRKPAGIAPAVAGRRPLPPGSPGAAPQRTRQD